MAGATQRRFAADRVAESMQTFVAILISQVRGELRPSNLSMLRQPRSKVSWVASSASWSDPSIR